MRGPGAITAGALALVASLAVCLAAQLKSDGMVVMPEGLYMSFLRVKALNASNADATSARRVDAFRLDEEPVTNAEFLDFVTAHPQWRKSQIKALFAEDGYLKRWPSDLETSPTSQPRRPIADVSWFAAEAYCKARGFRLPTGRAVEICGSPTTAAARTRCAPARSNGSPSRTVRIGRR